MDSCFFPLFPNPFLESLLSFPQDTTFSFLLRNKLSFFFLHYSFRAILSSASLPPSNGCSYFIVDSEGHPETFAPFIIPYSLFPSGWDVWKEFVVSPHPSVSFPFIESSAYYLMLSSNFFPLPFEDVPPSQPTPILLPPKASFPTFFPSLSLFLTAACEGAINPSWSSFRFSHFSSRNISLVPPPYLVSYPHYERQLSCPSFSPVMLLALFANTHRSANLPDQVWNPPPSLAANGHSLILRQFFPLFLNLFPRPKRSGSAPHLSVSWTWFLYLRLRVLCRRRRAIPSLD